MTLLASSLLDSLFGLTRVSWSDPGAALGWRTEWPAWAWVLIVLAATTAAGWSYHRMLGPRWARVALSALRATLIVLLAALLAGPMLVLKQERIDPDCLIVLVDRSASLLIKDMESGSDAGISRDDAMRSALERHQTIFGPDQLGGDHRQILWLGFDSATFELGPQDNTQAPGAAQGASAESSGDRSPVPGLGAAQGQSTFIRTAIDQAMQRVAGRPISGIVLLTDGRSPEATGAEVVRRLNQQGVGVYAVPLGATTAPLDLAIADVEAPDRAFINDIVPANVWIEAFPPDAKVDYSKLRVSLIDDQTGQVLDERFAAAAGQPVRLTAQSTTVGHVNWKVQIKYEAQTPTGQITELITENNEQLISLDLIDRPIRVLYVEGYPRWEYRYLKNMLVREKSIASSMLLLSADRAFAQEGDIPITRLPRSADELEPYDVIILGDVPSSYFGSELMTLLRDHVAIRGAGLLWIGGPGSTPRTYETTPLADLLPMRLPGAVERLTGPDRADDITVQPTALAEAYNVMRLTPLAGGASDAGASWPAMLPPLRWAQDLGPLKQIAEVLAQAREDNAAHPTSAQSQAGAPLIVRMPYGAGLSLYVATDETWRWRYGRGEFYFEQFWVQLVRMLGSNRLQRDTGAVRLKVSNRRVERDRAVLVELTVRDQVLLRRNLPRIAVEVVRADDPQSEPVDRIELLQDFAASGPAAQEGVSDPMNIARGRIYKALWQPATTGSLRLRVVEPALADLDLTDAIEVFHGDDEKRQPLPDHDRLAALAQQTGGRVIPLANLDELATAGVIPNRQIRTPNDVREPLWDSYLSLIVVLLLLTGEWVGRKVIRLV